MPETATIFHCNNKKYYEINKSNVTIGKRKYSLPIYSIIFSLIVISFPMGVRHVVGAAKIIRLLHNPYYLKGQNYLRSTINSISTISIIYP